jgi:hypothetical protein
VAGSGDGTVDLTTISVFANLLPGGGWNVGYTPIIAYNWDTEDWTIPLTLSGSKTIIFGEIPWKVGAELNYYVEQPDAFGPEWMASINFTPVVPNFLAGLFD